MKLILSIGVSIFFNLFTNGQQINNQSHHLKFEGDKMIFDKIYCLNSEGTPKSKALCPKSLDAMIEVYAECPKQIMASEDFLYDISTVGLLLCYKNNQEYINSFSGKYIFSFNRWEIDEATMAFFTPLSFHSKLNVIIDNANVNIEILVPSMQTLNFLKISEFKLTIQEFTQRLSSYQMFKAKVLGM